MDTIRTIAAGEFKQKCLALMEDVATQKQEIIITKHGHPLCKLVPLANKAKQLRAGWMKGTMTIKGDITKPIEDIWNANQ